MAIRTVFKVVGFNLTASVASSTEAGAAAIVIVRLLSKPSSPLLVTASSSNAAEAVSNPNFLILSETNWDIGEAIQFEGQSDTEDDGDQAYLATCAVMVTQDPDYTKVFPTLPHKDTGVTPNDQKVAPIFFQRDTNVSRSCTKNKLKVCQSEPNVTPK